MRTSEQQRIPILIRIIAIISLFFITVPVLSLLNKLSLSTLWHELGERAVRETLGLSLWTSLTSMLLSIFFGVPLAILLAQTRSRWILLIRPIATFPIILPPVVAGVALLLAFGRNGLLGRYLWEWFHIQLPFSPAAVIIAQTFVSMPFLVFAVEGALKRSDQDLEDAAQTAGANKMQVLWHVTLPLIWPSLISGAILAWARALGEFGATITFAGSFPGRTQTLPISVYYALESKPEAAIALSMVMIVVSISVLVLLGIRERANQREKEG